MLERIESLRTEAEGAIAAAADPAALEQLRVRHLGRRSDLTAILRGIGELPADQRGAVGIAANEAREALEALLAHRAEELAAAEEALRRGTPLTFGQWASVFLRDLKAPVARNNLIVMVTWQVAEY
ncbi:MAG: hypothetical protein ACRDKX_07205, partial [Solirubrobacterales bacterium]